MLTNLNTSVDAFPIGQAFNVIYQLIVKHVRLIRFVSDQQTIDRYVSVPWTDLVRSVYLHQHVQSMLVKIMDNVYQLM